MKRSLAFLLASLFCITTHPLISRQAAKTKPAFRKSLSGAPSATQMNIKHFFASEGDAVDQVKGGIAILPLGNE
ncbi:MAG TPA: hypothetical protein VI215_07265 [Bacteroidota bacterium]|jgi:hypothetical protein